MNFGRLFRFGSDRGAHPRIRAQSDSVPVDSATTLALDAQWSAATGSASNALQSAAMEIAAGIIGRAFATATIEGDPFKVVTPSVLMMTGRELVRRGEAGFLIDGPPFELIPATNVYASRGTYDRGAWAYLLSLNGPSDSVSKWYLADEVIHVRINEDPASPWRGRSPFDVAKLSSETMTYAERSARDEARVPSARIGVYAGTDDTQRAQYQKNLSSGGVQVLSTSQLQATAAGVEPANRYSPGTMHPDHSAGHVQLRRDSLIDLCSAAGIPASLIDSRADGGSRREGYRQLLHGTIQPMARIAQRELSEKLGADIKLSFRRLAAGDLGTRTRAVKQLTESGMTLDQALAVVQLVDGED